MRGILTDTAQHGEAFPGRGVPQRLVCGIYRRNDLLHSLFQKAFLKGCNWHFTQNRKKIFVQRVRVMRMGGFFYGIPLGAQPYLSQCVKGQVSSFQIVEPRLCFLLNRHTFDLSIDRAIDVAPLDFPIRCTRFDVAAFPPTILAFVNVFSPSCHFCFLLRLGPPFDHLFCPPTFSAGFFHAELGNVQKTFSFCEVFSKVI